MGVAMVGINMRKTILVLEPTPANDVPPPPPTPTNAALLAGIQSGDAECFYQLFRRHGDLIRGVIARFVSGEDECEDVVREVFELIRDRAEHYSLEKGHVLGWMITLARRCASNRAQSLAAQAEAAPATTEVTEVREVARSGKLHRNKGANRHVSGGYPNFAQAA